MPQIYNLVKQADGKYTVQKVDVFRLGECKNFNFDNSWAERTIEHMAAMKEEGYLPPVIAGHNPRWDDMEEKPTMGFMDNFSVEFGTVPGSGVIYCDLVDINEADLPVIKDMKFPYRSVEVHPEEQYFCALALLGGTEPYHKLPRLQVNDKVVGFARDDKKKQVFAFAVTADGLEYQERKTKMQQFKDWVRAVFMDEMDDDDDQARVPDGSTSRGACATYYGAERRKAPAEVMSCERRKNEFKYNTTEGRDTIVPTTFGTGGKTMPQVKMTDEQRESFKLEFGAYPEELKAQSDKNQAQAEAFRVSAEKSAAEKFEADLKAEKVSPAAITVINDVIKCAKENKPGELQAKLIELIKCANDGTLIVPADDAAKAGDRTVDFSDDEAVSAAIADLQAKEPGLSFEAAWNKVKASRGGK